MFSTKPLHSPRRMCAALAEKRTRTWPWLRALQPRYLTCIEKSEGSPSREWGFDSSVCVKGRKEDARCWYAMCRTERTTSQGWRGTDTSTGVPLWCAQGLASVQTPLPCANLLFSVTLWLDDLSQKICAYRVCALLFPRGLHDIKLWSSNSFALCFEC